MMVLCAFHGQNITIHIFTEEGGTYEIGGVGVCHGGDKLLFFKTRIIIVASYDCFQN